MKIVLRYNRKKNDLEYIMWPESRPIPPIIDPPEPDEPKDGAPPLVKENARTFNKRRRKKGFVN